MTMLLHTKLVLPPPPAGIVVRPRLIARLDQALDARLVLIAAPAGSGKTTLLSEWLHRGRDGKTPLSTPVAWLTLDESDNDPTRFLSYLIAALQTCRPELGDTIISQLQSPQPPPPQYVLTTLINEISARPQALLLILDDLHTVDSRPVHDALGFLLAHQPPNLHLVIASRADPPLALARLRSHGQLIELRAGDLNFTAAEGDTFLKQIMGLELSYDATALLMDRVEGWPAGLQLAALSLRNLTPEQIEAAIATFGASHRFILDYLTEEVLAKQPPEVRSFMLQTAVLDQMNAPLCDAVTGRDDGQAMLEQLEQANLFVVPLDGERHWYRYHHLFAELLRKQLGTGNEMQTCHRRASDWYAAAGRPLEAISHAFSACDLARAAELIAENALLMLEKGELTTFANWMHLLPAPLLRQRPWLNIAGGWLLAYTGKLGAIEEKLVAAASQLEQVGDPKERRRIEGHIAAVRAYTSALMGDPAAARAAAEAALADLPAHDRLARGNASLTLGSACRDLGDLQAAESAFARAADLSWQAGYHHIAVLAQVSQAWLQIERGQLAAAMDTCKHTLQSVAAKTGRDSEGSPSVGMVYACQSAVLREWNQLEEALQLAHKSVALAERWGQTNILVNSYLNLAAVLRSRNDLDGALAAVAKSKQLANDLSPFVIDRLQALEVELCLLQNNLAAAAQWLRESNLAVTDEIDCRDARYLTLAHVLLAQGRSAKARELIERLLDAAEQGERVGEIILLRALLALALQAAGQHAQAQTALVGAIELAEPANYLRVFADQGEPMTKLLRQAALHDIAPSYVGRILAAMGTPAPPHSRALLVDPLSERELQVLRLIAAGLSNQQIADELFLSLGTVKKHTNNIYGKLAVRSRTQAVLRAQELQLIS